MRERVTERVFVPNGLFAALTGQHQLRGKLVLKLGLMEEHSAEAGQSRGALLFARAKTPNK